MLGHILTIILFTLVFGGGAYLLFLQGGGLASVSSEVRHDDENDRA